MVKILKIYLVIAHTYCSYQSGIIGTLSFTMILAQFRIVSYACLRSLLSEKVQNFADEQGIKAKALMNLATSLQIVLRGAVLYNGNHF